MPRGVYDRSKARKKAVSESVAASAAPSATGTTKRAYKTRATPQASESHDSSAQFAELQKYLTVLTQVRLNASTPEINNEITQTIASLRILREKLFHFQAPEQVVAKQVQPPMVQAAPVPFNPPALQPSVQS